MPRRRQKNNITTFTSGRLIIIIIITTLLAVYIYFSHSTKSFLDTMRMSDEALKRMIPQETDEDLITTPNVVVLSSPSSSDDTQGIVVVHTVDYDHILHRFMTNPSIDYMVCLPPRMIGAVDPHRIVRCTGDAFLGFFYDSSKKQFVDDFLVVQRSRMAMRWLHHASSRPRDDRFQKTLLQKLDAHCTQSSSAPYYLRTYFTFIFINDVGRAIDDLDTATKYYIHNHVPTDNNDNGSICQTWISHGTNIRHLYDSSESIKRDYPGYGYRLFDDFEMKQFIRRFYSTKVLERYDSILPSAFKSDFFRYLYLYRFGGYYFDITLLSIKPLSDYVNVDDYDFICPIDLDLSTRQLYQAFMYARKAHPYIGECIRRIMEYDLEKHQWFQCLAVTGPKLIGDVCFNDHSGRSRNLFLHHTNARTIDFIHDEDGSRTPIMYTKGAFPEQQIGRSMYSESQKNHYSKHCVYQTFFYH